MGRIVTVMKMMIVGMGTSSPADLGVDFFQVQGEEQGVSLWRPKSGFVQQRVVEPRLVCNQPSYTILAKIHQPWARTATAVLYYCLFALNLIFEFQTFFTSKNGAKNKVLATSPCAGSSVLYGDVVIFATRRLSHGEKRSEVLKSHFVWEIHDFFACTFFLGFQFFLQKSRRRVVQLDCPLVRHMGIVGTPSWLGRI